MPDTFFRTIIYSAAAVVLGAGVFIATANKGVSGEGGEILSAPIPSTVTVPGHGNGSSAPAQHQQHAARGQSESLADAWPSLESVAAQDQSAFRQDEEPAQSKVYAPAHDVIPRMMIHIGREVIELAVPVNPQSGQSVQMPAALALAMNPVGLPPQMQESVEAMALDFVRDVTAGAAQDPYNEAYLQRWQDAAFFSDRNFRMRYGRVAYVQMNLLLGQETAAGIR